MTTFMSLIERKSDYILISDSQQSLQAGGSVLSDKMGSLLLIP